MSPLSSADRHFKAETNLHGAAARKRADGVVRVPTQDRIAARQHGGRGDIAVPKLAGLFSKHPGFCHRVVIGILRSFGFASCIAAMAYRST
jgi:hypothetical protein